MGQLWLLAPELWLLLFQLRRSPTTRNRSPGQHHLFQQHFQPNCPFRDVWLWALSCAKLGLGFSSSFSFFCFILESFGPSVRLLAV